MSTLQQTADYIVAQLEPLDVRVRKMFGEYGLYCDEKVAAFICDDTLFVKILPENEKLAAALPKAPAYPGSKDYYAVPDGKLQDDDWLRRFIQVTADAVPAKKKK
jgi:TfoX/Sxy family transcriptional regulator of competence genes